jgi:hypothetical protein
MGYYISRKHESWDCIFADRVGADGRIYLASPQQYGVMYVSTKPDIKGRKVKHSVPTECGPIRGAYKEAKFLIAVAICTAYNKQQLKTSGGLVLRVFSQGTPFATPETWIVNSPGIGLRVKNTTGWIAYVSPNGKFHTVINNRYKGNELPGKQTEAIQECIEHLLSEDYGR